MPLITRTFWDQCQVTHLTRASCWVQLLIDAQAWPFAVQIASTPAEMLINSTDLHHYNTMPSLYGTDQQATIPLRHHHYSPPLSDQHLHLNDHVEVFIPLFPRVGSYAFINQIIGLLRIFDALILHPPLPSQPTNPDRLVTFRLTSPKYTANVRL